MNSCNRAILLNTPIINCKNNGTQHKPKLGLAENRDIQKPNNDYFRHSSIFDTEQRMDTGFNSCALLFIAIGYLQ